MENEAMTVIQRQLGYTFKNPELLNQALTRSSYAEENGGEDNEVLEFIGDKVLDVLIVKILTEKFGHFAEQNKAWTKIIYTGEFISDCKEGKLSEIKARLVNKRTLADKMDMLGFAKYLKMGQGDIKTNISAENSVKEDLFEAILGAIALDSNWNLTELQGVVEIMLDPDSYFDDGNDNYVQIIQHWTADDFGGIPLFHYKKAGYDLSFWDGFNGISQTFNILGDLQIRDIQYHCYLKIRDDLPIFRGFGKSKSEGRKAACKVAVDYLVKHGMLYETTIKDEIKNPNKEEAVNQLEILARRGYFSIPAYEFEQSYDKDGNPIWECKGEIEEYKQVFSGRSSSKKDAKKSAAFSMLEFVLQEGEC